MKPAWSLLTGSGAGAIQIVGITDPGHSLERRFAKSFRGEGLLRHGWLRDNGRDIDEILLETTPEGWRLHLHGGHATWLAVRDLLVSWGAEPAAETGSGTTLAEELLWALTHAPTDHAVDAAVDLFSTLPGAADPSALLAGYDYGRSLFEPVTVVLAGAPNAGKSTLMNRLLGSERMIVSSTPGTTRDLIETGLEIAGRQVRLVDGAGLRPTEDELESAGQSLVRDRLEGALVLWIVNPHGPAPEPLPVGAAGLVLTHLDLGPAPGPGFGGPVVRSGDGTDIGAVRDLIESLLPDPVIGPVIFTPRQKKLVEASIESGGWPPAEWKVTAFPGFTPVK